MVSKSNTDEECWLTTPSGLRLHAYYCPASAQDSHSSLLPHPAQGNWVVMYCHGNGTNISFLFPSVEDIQQHLGADVFLFDYRGYGRSDGQPSEQGLYEDTMTAYRFLTETKNIHPERLLVLGRSLGGGLATQLATKVPFKALILQNTFTSMPAAGWSRYPWLPVPWMMRNRYPNIHRLAEIERPVHLTFGDDDQVVPPSHSQRLYEVAREPKAIFRVEGGSHSFRLERDYYEHLASFLANSYSTPPVVGTALTTDNLS